MYHEREGINREKYVHNMYMHEREGIICICMKERG